MECVIARRMAAMFSHFVKQRVGGSESFAAKQNHFYEELRSLKTLRISQTVLRIQRDNLIGSTMSQTKKFAAKDWYKNLSIAFEGEIGLDAGGLTREWLNLLCIKLFEHNVHGLFSCLGNSRLVHPNPPERRNSEWTSLKYYEFAGKIVGKCLFETAVGSTHKQMVNGKFSRSFLAQVIGLNPNYKHFEQDDPDLYVGKIKYILENEVEPLDLTFTEEEYSRSGKPIKVVDLLPNGSKLKVTEANKEDYLQQLANYKLVVKVTKEVEAFIRGLRELVPEELLSNFDENELELLWCGKSQFNLEDLQSHYIKGGWDFDTAYKRVLGWFWMCISGLSDEEKARLLQFTTGSSLLPHGGFKDLNPKFKISLSVKFARLPYAHTCINEICLSDNTSFENFEKCFKIAINEGNQGFDFH